MANPQRENGHTRIANEILEALARAKLSGREWQIVMEVIRETYGFTRKTAQLAGSYMSGKTGIAPNHCRAIIKRLIAKNILYREGISDLGIQKDYDLWVVPKTGSPETRTSPGTGTTTSPGTGTLASPENGTQVNKPSTKTLKKPLGEKKPHPTKDFLTRYKKYHDSRYESPLHIVGGKDAKLVQGLLKTYGFDPLVKLATAFLDGKDDWAKENLSRGIGTFASRINRISKLLETSGEQDKWHKYFTS